MTKQPIYIKEIYNSDNQKVPFGIGKWDLKPGVYSYDSCSVLLPANLKTGKIYINQEFLHSGNQATCIYCNGLKGTIVVQQETSIDKNFPIATLFV